MRATVNHRLISFLFAIAATGMATPTAEAAEASNRNWDFRVTTGYDDNPLKLNPSMVTAPDTVPNSAMGEFQMGYRSERKSSDTLTLFARGGVRATKYVGAADAADRNSARLTLGATDRSMRVEAGAVRLTVGGSFRWNDLTFINNNTGRPVAGLEDRFDTLRYTGFARIRAPLSESSQVRADVAVSHQDYIKDYIDLGQESLDYTQFDFRPGYRTALAGGTRLRLTGHYGYRMYSARRADDLDGNPINGTSLNYHFFGGKIDARNKVSGSATAGFSVDVERRLDSEVGFNNRTTYNVSGKLGYDINKRNELSVNLSYQYREYDHLDAANVSVTNDGGRKRQGYRLFLTYVSREAVMGLDAFARYRRDSFTNSDLIYEYDRNVVTAGLRGRF